MRLCVIGNSQLAALRLGWDVVAAEHDWLRPTFFGAGAARMAGLQQQGTQLIPDSPSLARRLAHTAGGLSRIELAEYDAVLLVGLNYNLPALLDPRLSTAVREAAILGGFAATLCGRVLHQVRAACPAQPIHLMPNPQRRRAAGTPVRRDRGDPAARLAMVEPVLAASHAPLAMVGQPAATLTPEGHTADTYGIAAVGLDLGDGPRLKGPDDLSHMNAAYGTAVLRDWLPALRREAAVP